MLYPRHFFALTIVLLSSLVSVGVVHGLWTGRWDAVYAQEMMLELEKMPLTVGTWEGKTADEATSRDVLPDSTNYLLRRYVNSADGTVADVLFTRGRPGPMVIKHLPTECYVSAGYDIVKSPKRYASPIPNSKQTDDFWVANFKKSRDGFSSTIRVYWSWTGDGYWKTPDRPRFALAHHPTLYKLYVSQTLSSENEPLEGAPIHEFIRELTEGMRETIFNPSRS